MFVFVVCLSCCGFVFCWLFGLCVLGFGFGFGILLVVFVVNVCFKIAIGLTWYVDRVFYCGGLCGGCWVLGGFNGLLVFLMFARLLCCGVMFSIL